MLRIALAAVVCTLTACATIQPPKPEPVPPDLVPAGPITETGPDGRPTTVGTR